MLELVGFGYDLMPAELRRAVETPDTDRRMLRVAAEYMRFAGKHPHLYQVMNGTSGDVAERQRAEVPAKELLIELLAARSQAHGVVGRPVRGLRDHLGQPARHAGTRVPRGFCRRDASDLFAAIANTCPGHENPRRKTSPSSKAHPRFSA